MELLTLCITLNLNLMALISCPECGKQISDKAVSCPNCGNPINLQTSQQEEYLCCPKCASRELHAEHKGFSGGKALAGVLVTGGIGLLAGTIGSRETQITCLKCGNRFKAGEAKVIRNTSKASDEAQIIELIKSKGQIYAVKWYKETYNCGLAEAKNVVDSIMVKHHISLPPESSGMGCSVIILIGLGLTIGAISLF